MIQNAIDRSSKQAVVGSTAATKPRADGVAEVVVVVDYHLKNLEFRLFNRTTGELKTFNRETSLATLEAVLQDALGQARSIRGEVVWIIESTTGWARVKDALAGRCRFLVVNVLQLPLPPKAHRRKTDKLDTSRVLREYLNGQMSCAWQPDINQRALRRLVALREDLVAQQTALKNQITSHLSHERWESSANLWSGVGRRKLDKIIAQMNEVDQFTIKSRLQLFDAIELQLKQVNKKLESICDSDPDAQALDMIKGVAPVSAVSILARIGSVERFKSSDELVSYAGLAPGIRSSDSSSHSMKIGGGGTDKRLRHYLIEATTWARKIPRYAGAYQRTLKRRGKKVARVSLARMILRSIFAILRDGVAFDPRYAKTA